MRISIWQQFSSNHSASYTVIGKFQDAQAAEEAVEILQEILQELIVNYGDWYNKSSELWGAEIGERYGFEWKEDIDWLLDYYRKRRNPNREIHSFENLLFVGPLNFRILTWQNGHQFENILKALGANTLRSSAFALDPEGKDDNANIDFTLQCEATTEKEAKQLAKILQKHIDDNKKYSAGVWDWLPYHPDWEELSSGLSLEAIRSEEAVLLAERQAWRKHIRQFEALKKQSWNQWQKLIREEEKNVAPSIFKQKPEIRERINILRDGTNLGQWLELKQQRQNIRLATRFMKTALILLRVLMPWLKSKGCSVSYDFQQV